MRTRIKFCGCRSEKDVENAVRVGADAVGFVFAPSSRRVTFEVAAGMLRLIPQAVQPVAILVEPSHDDLLRVEQLNSNMALQVCMDAPRRLLHLTDRQIIATLRVDDKVTPLQLEAMLSDLPGRTVLFDTKVPGVFGGTGSTFAWD
ncbi:MAG: N-(5'-phosphoribosyl)anthranilate isomerase, partial [Candidatus Eremiobacteraeota bacterium]|nr:N-(5'-phosphoribosyl)anthranilate isomerase [Candidatus Eremiobacteraeota bacterium]